MRASGLFIPLCLLGCSVSSAWAAPGATTAEVMALPLSARVIGMGEAFSAVDGGIDSISVNPAGLAAMKSPELSTLYASLVSGLTQGEVSYGIPTRLGSFAGEFMSFGSGAVDCYDANDNACGKVSAQDQFLRAGYARQIIDGISVGGDFTYLSETLAGIRAQTELFDLGARAQVLGSRLSLALSYRNLGQGLKFDSTASPTPQSLTFGLAWNQPVLNTLRVSFAADEIEPNDASAELHFGTELWMYDTVALRLGYVTEEDLGAGLRMGVGMRWASISADYALASEGQLGYAHYVSISWRFAKPMAGVVAHAETRIDTATGENYNPIVPGENGHLAPTGGKP